MLRYITAKFESQCAETGKPIKVGDRVVFNDRTKKVYASGSPTQQQFIKDRKPKTTRRRKDKYYNWQDIYNR